MLTLSTLLSFLHHIPIAVVIISPHPPRSNCHLYGVRNHYSFSAPSNLALGAKKKEGIGRRKPPQSSSSLFLYFIPSFLFSPTSLGTCILLIRTKFGTTQTGSPGEARGAMKEILSSPRSVSTARPVNPSRICRGGLTYLRGYSILFLPSRESCFRHSLS